MHRWALLAGRGGEGAAGQVEEGRVVVLMTDPKLHSEAFGYILGLIWPQCQRLGGHVTLLACDQQASGLLT